MSQKTAHRSGLTPTGIDGLDAVLLGGIRRGNVILIEGAPGTGKSTFAMEFAYRGATELSEPAVIIGFESPIARTRDDAKGFGWDFDAAEASGRLAILKITPDQLIENIRLGTGIVSDTIKRIGAKRLIIDGLTSLRLHVGSGGELPYRDLLSTMITRFRDENVTMLLTTESSSTQKLGETGAGHENFLCDTILSVRKEAQRRNVNRSIEISKSRGQEFVAGRNSFRIVSGFGFKVFVRAYARERMTSPVKASSERITMGISGLDEMLGGGVYRGSSTLMVGISGTGKTVAAMHFLAEGVRNGEKGLMVTLDEQPDSFSRNAGDLGFNMQDALKNGDIMISHESPLELDLDEHFAVVEKAIKESGVKRVVIDSLAAYEMILPKESHEFLFALSSYLKSQGITSMFSYECPEMLGVSNLGYELKASSVADNIVLMNFVEISTRLRRAVTISKCNGHSQEDQTREYVIRKGGITLLDESTVPSTDKVPQLPLSCYYGVLARSPTRHSPIIDEHVASGKPMPKSRIPKPAKRAKADAGSSKSTPQ